MEAAARRWRVGSDAPRLTILRIGNVVGADTLLGGGVGPVSLHRFADGSGPRRSYIGPVALARTLAGLAAAPALPPVLNVAAPGAVAMADLLEAAGRCRRWSPAPEGTVREVTLDTSLLGTILDLPPGGAAAMVAEWRQLCREPSPCP
jgi:nucleoside-diphosphate-sugar epimerase